MKYFLIKYRDGSFKNVLLKLKSYSNGFIEISKYVKT